MLKVLPHQPVPDWLKNYRPGDRIPFNLLVQDSVYYPACGFDGDVAIYAWDLATPLFMLIIFVCGTASVKKLYTKD